MADHIGSIHHEYLYTQDDVIQSLPEIIYHLESFDQNLVRSAILCYLSSRLAADYVKVILTGEGADELFAGYTYYKEIPSPDLLHAELRRSLASLHNMNLPRVDRLTMCHGIEGRVPFLDTALIELAQTVPPALKLRTTDSSQPVEKWILRTACEILLPPESVWRDKEQFDEGSGTVDLLDAALQMLTARSIRRSICARAKNAPTICYSTESSTMPRWWRTMWPAGKTIAFTTVECASAGIQSSDRNHRQHRIIRVNSGRDSSS